jgi:hypothetical protein
VRHLSADHLAVRGHVLVDRERDPAVGRLTLAPGCDRIYAYVRAEHVAGPTGAIQGQANNLTDVTGSSGTGLPEHDPAMTHIFAV